jgi:hypothetical protein
MRSRPRRRKNMQRSPLARLVWASIAALAVTLTAPLTVGAQGQEQVTICHRTGSNSTPWVLMIIDARLWPEYQAQGDKRASSLADCTEPAAAPAEQAQGNGDVPASAANAQAPPALAPVAAAAAPVALQPLAQSSTPAPAPTLAPPTAVPTQATTVETASIGAAQSTASPEVSNLPKSGEPDRPLLVLGLLAVAATGLLLRRVVRATS